MENELSHVSVFLSQGCINTTQQATSYFTVSSILYFHMHSHLLFFSMDFNPLIIYLFLDLAFIA